MNPVWNESFNLEFEQTLFSKNLLTITVWDSHIWSDDFLGHCMIDINHTPLDGSSIWKTLEPRPGKQDKVQGQIRISLVPGAHSSEDKSVKTKPASSQAKSRIEQAQEEGLTELDLTGCNLKELPSMLLEQYQWTVLDIGFNQFREWPAEISNFKLLSELFLSGNQLVELGASLGELTQLRELYVNGNSLVSLTEHVSSLTNLEKLDLANNALRTLPPEIGSIENLEELKLSGNPLKALPSEIGNLQYLLVLDLSFCNMISLPSSFIKLTRLLELDLSSNHLESLPPKFGDMTRLVTLSLLDNKLQELPISMGQMKQLSNCTIDGNPIKDDALWKKYGMGTAHLVDYLDKKLFESEQLAKREAKKGIDGKKKKVKRPRIPIDSPGQKDSIEEDIQWIEPKQNIKTDVEQKVEDLSLLTDEERATRKRFKALEFSHHIKKQLIEYKKAVMLAKTIEEAIPPAKVIRDLKIVLDHANKILPYTEPPLPAQLFPNDTQLQKLKKTVMVAMKDAETTVMKMLNILSSLIPEHTVDMLRETLDEVNELLRANPLQTK